MISTDKELSKYCKLYHLVENYIEARFDETQMWDCHHKREITDNKSRKQLIAEGLYYDVNPDELIFMTKAEHLSLHKKCDRHHLFGKHHSDETRKKISESNKGERNPMFGKHNTNAGLPKKSVMCIETGEVFDSLSDAVRNYNLNYGNLSECCNGKLKSCGKLHWKWV